VGCRITISAAGLTMEAELDDSATALAICAALPITSRAQTWGDEVYFRIPVDLDEAPDARTEVAVGDLAYWPAGKALCAFFGPTPASVGEQPRAASPVNVVGRIDGKATALRQVHSGTEVLVRKAAA
jgi:hypothetical protein